MVLKKAITINLLVEAVLLIFGICCVLAVTTTVWEQNSQEDFSDGKPEGVSISSKNEITLSRALLPIEGDISELRIWCLVQDSQGNVYAGTGDKGKIFKIAEEGQVSLLFDSPETDILSLIIDDEDNLYAGTSPDGIIYRIKSGQVPETFFNSDEKYVWSMAFDRAGNLYAGTGMTGKLYRIKPDGQGETVYDSNDGHIKCLLNSAGNIYAGTEDSGIIYKISSDGQVFVVYDTSEREICCLVADAHGNIYAGTASGEAAPGRDEQDGPGPPGFEREGAKPKSMIYRITPDEVVTAIWESPEPLLFSMVVHGDNLMVGTGDEGKIYSVTPDGDWASVADCEESQVLSLLYKMDNSGEIWLATGNAGKLYKLSSNYIKEGTLESSERDASVTSTWGKISWEAVQSQGTSVTLSTRSGNTEKPDDTWSEWSQEYIDSAGEAIASPSARFIQWRAKLTSDEGAATPTLKRVSVAYLQKNLKPDIRSVTIGSEQQERSEGPPRRPSSRRSNGEEGGSNSQNIPLRGKKVIKWQARDPNGDSLEYSVYFRGIEEQNWKLLEEELAKTSHPLDSESFPDGAYVIKVIATDSPSNPKELALSHEEVSDPFEIDNTPPKVIELKAESAGDDKYTVTGKVEDAASYIKSMIYSIDGGDWELVFPSDQILDSRAEDFSFSTETLAKGEHTIVVKASDAAGNVGSAKIVIPAQ